MTPTTLHSLDLVQLWPLLRWLLVLLALALALTPGRVGGTAISAEPDAVLVAPTSHAAGHVVAWVTDAPAPPDAPPPGAPPTLPGPGGDCA